MVWNTVAQNRLWVVLLTAIGNLSSAIYAHVLLVAFGAIAIGLVHQLYGFGLCHSPQTAESLAWGGLVMGLGTILMAAIAALRPAFS